MAILLGASLSSFVRKVLIFSFEAGIELEHRNDIVPFPASAELLAVNPRGKIPGYSDDDIKLGESSVICTYLDRKHGAPAFIQQMHRLWPCAVVRKIRLGRIDSSHCQGIFQSCTHQNDRRHA